MEEDNELNEPMDRGAKICKELQNKLDTNVSLRMEETTTVSLNHGMLAPDGRKNKDESNRV